MKYTILLLSVLCFSCTDYTGFGQKWTAVDSAHVKITNNKGQGDTTCWGTRNMRVVLKGVLYRGGGNNLHLKPLDAKKYNQNPLPLVGVKSLHEIGFEKAIYLYSKNFESMYPPFRIDSLKQQGFIYECRPEWTEVELKAFIEEIYQKLQHPPYQPIYIHCWNGWHQSGLVSAVMLMQFCDLNNYQAIQYWEKNTDGNFKGFAAVKKKILAFRKIPDFAITEDQKKQICPCLLDSIINAQPSDEIKKLEQEGNDGAGEFMEPNKKP
jgi:hypothetical protein